MYTKIQKQWNREALTLIECLGSDPRLNSWSEEMENLFAMKAIYASKRQVHSKPVWRMACMGLNMEGKCQNAQCEAFNSRVRCQKGFGVFNVGEPVLCPMCDSVGSRATRIGFIGCQWMIEQPGENSKWRESGRDEYQRFGVLDAAAGRKLIVTIKPPPVIGLPT